MLPLLAESWTWFAVVTFIFAARLISRSLLFGSPSKLQIDDWVMVLAWASYIVFIATINIVSTHDSNLLPENYDIKLLTPEDVRNREYGSKMILVVEQCQCITIWAVKACLLIMYHRLTYVILSFFLSPFPHIFVFQCTRASRFVGFTPWLRENELTIFTLHSVALSESVVVKALAGYIAFGFVFMEVFYFAVWCRPFNMYWAVPTHSK